MGLGGLNVLLTRPLGRADGLIDGVKALGGCPTHLPLLEIAELDPDLDRQHLQFAKNCFMELDRYQQVIFISVNAVEMGVGWIDRYWPQLPMGIGWHGIGAATVAALEAQDIPVGNSNLAMDSEGLLSMSAFQNMQNQAVLIVRGVGGREHLAVELTRRGARVDYAETYRRRMPEGVAAGLKALWSSSRPGLICVNSGETLKNLLIAGEGLSPEELRETPLLVPSQRVADSAENEGFRAVIVAENAGVAATLRAIEVFAHQGEITKRRDNQGG